MAKGGFTIPGESGYEELTLKLAEKWGADVVRDSDGTALSPEILDSGYGVYSTLCVIRADNAWADAHRDKLQQNFLMSFPVVASSEIVVVDLLAGYSRDQFRLNDWDGVEEFWQVFDRTTNREVDHEQWQLNEDGTVTIVRAIQQHVYTVNFLVTRVWEEISMYNHLTNEWGDRERLLAVEPRYPDVAAHLRTWLEHWCVNHPSTTVVRFTSLFYNFAWFWGSDDRLQHVFTDWGGYDFTVTPLALRLFREQTGLQITSEDFVNRGRYTTSHNPPSPIYREWIRFVGEFVRDLGAQLVDIVHRHGKKAYVFYDDSWIGIEPYSGHFDDIGFDGIIKAVFSAYESRLCAGVDVDTHEIRLHPYLFPVDLEGKPTFAPGGDPTADLAAYWRTTRRALLRAPIERIGLGGYLSLVEPFTDFQEEVAAIAEQHRSISDLHRQSRVSVEPIRIAVVTSWGSLRSWSTAGHLHEHPGLTLTHVLESLAGLPFDISFVSIRDIAEGCVLDGIDVLINAGEAGTAWSGGSDWNMPNAVEAVRSWVRSGGGLLGIRQPSALTTGLTTFQLFDLLGVDQDCGDRRCLGTRSFRVCDEHPILTQGATVDLPVLNGVFLTSDSATVLAANNGTPTVVTEVASEGRAVYLSGYRHTPGNARLMSNAIHWIANSPRTLPWALNPAVDVAQFADSSILLVANSTGDDIVTDVVAPLGSTRVALAPGQLEALAINREGWMQ